MKNHTIHAAGTMVVLALAVIHSFAQSNYEPYTFTTLTGGGSFVSPDQTGTRALSWSYRPGSGQREPLN